MTISEINNKQFELRAELRKLSALKNELPGGSGSSNLKISKFHLRSLRRKRK